VPCGIVLAFGLAKGLGMTLCCPGRIGWPGRMGVNLLPPNAGGLGPPLLGIMPLGGGALAEEGGAAVGSGAGAEALGVCPFGGGVAAGVFAAGPTRE